MNSMLHPQGGEVTVEELIERLGALESRNSLGAALQGGTAVTYDANGRIINLNASSINAGTINASVITVSNINASNISSGTLSANRIGANSIEASKLSVSELSAISANLGTITAGVINGGSINGVTITGGVVRTAGSGRRIELNSAYNDIYLYNSGGSLAGKVFLDGDALALAGDMAGNDGLIELYDNAAWVYTNLVVAGWGSFGGDIDLNSHILNEIGYLDFNTSSNSSEDGRLWYYNGGGDTRYFRARLVSWNGQFDMTGF